MFFGMWLSSCFEAVKHYAIPDPIFREMMDYEIASQVAEGCISLEITKSKSEARSELETKMREAGFADDVIGQKLRLARAERGDAYLKAYIEVLPVDQNNACEIGLYEIERKSSVGLLLTEV